MKCHTVFLVAATLLLAGCAKRSEPDSAAAPPGVWKRLELAILEDYDKGEDLALVERDFLTFRELGIRTWRGSFGWDDYEPRRGRYDFTWLHEFVRRAERRGITLRPYIAYTPAWAASPGGGSDGQVWNDPPRRVDDWRRFVAALAHAMSRHRNIASYEIYNEANVNEWWDGTAEEYGAVLRAGAEAIRAADPNAQVLLGGMVWPDPEWLESVCGEAPRAFDVVPFHAYPETWTPDSVDVENYLGPGYREFLAALDACGPRPVWINEAGFATVPGRSETDQALWWARALATFAAAPRVTHIGVYEIKDLRPDREAIGGAANYHLGLLTADRRRKLAFHTVAFFARFFDAESVLVDGGGITVLRLDATAERGSGRPAGAGASRDPDRIDRHLFRRPDGRQLAVLWTHGDRAVDVDLVFSHRGSRAFSHALTGTPSRLGRFDGRRVRRLRLEPGSVSLITVEP